MTDRDGGGGVGKETLSHGFRTVYSLALEGSARGKACGQALAGSLAPRGTARASTILQHRGETEGQKIKRHKKEEKSVPVLSNTGRVSVEGCL